VDAEMATLGSIVESNAHVTQLELLCALTTAHAVAKIPSLVQTARCVCPIIFLLEAVMLSARALNPAIRVAVATLMETACVNQVGEDLIAPPVRRITIHCHQLGLQLLLTPMYLHWATQPQQRRSIIVQCSAILHRIVRDMVPAILRGVAFAIHSGTEMVEVMALPAHFNAHVMLWVLHLAMMV
jgi:hypothetical protein